MIASGSRRGCGPVRRAPENEERVTQNEQNAAEARIWNRLHARRFVVEIAEVSQFTDWDDNYLFGTTTVVARIVRQVSGEELGAPEVFYVVDPADVQAWKNGAEFVYASQSEIDSGEIRESGRCSTSHGFEPSFVSPREVAYARELCAPQWFVRR